MSDLSQAEIERSNAARPPGDGAATCVWCGRGRGRYPDNAPPCAEVDSGLPLNAVTGRKDVCGCICHDSMPSGGARYYPEDWEGRRGDYTLLVRYATNRESE